MAWTSLATNLDLFTYIKAIPTKEEYTLAWSRHETFTKTEHILSQKPHFNKFKCIEIKTYVLTFIPEGDKKLSTVKSQSIPKYLEINQHTSK